MRVQFSSNNFSTQTNCIAVEYIDWKKIIS